MKKLIVMFVMLIGMVGITFGQAVANLTCNPTYTKVASFAVLDSAETQEINVNLNAEVQKKIEMKIKIDSISGTGKCAVYRWGKLFDTDAKTYIDTVNYAGTGADTTIKKSATSVVNYRHYGYDIKGTGGSVRPKEFELKTW